MALRKRIALFESNNKDKSIKDEISEYIKNGLSDAYIEAKIWGKWKGQYSIGAVSKMIKGMKSEKLSESEEIDEENKIISDLLKTSTANIVDTWLDDNDSNKADIAELIKDNVSKSKPIKLIKRKYGMDIQLFKINGIDVVFAFGQPDSMFYKKSDEKELLNLVK